MTATRIVEIHCDGRDPLPGTEHDLGCYTTYVPPGDAPFEQRRTAAGLRRLAKKDGWTSVAARIGRQRWDRDYCPKHKPEPEPAS